MRDAIASGGARASDHDLDLDHDLGIKEFNRGGRGELVALLKGLWELLFRPFGARTISRLIPTACAVGFILAPLRGWLGLIGPLGI